jgi:hypothetical protein
MTHKVRLRLALEIVEPLLTGNTLTESERLLQQFTIAEVVSFYTVWNFQPLTAKSLAPTRVGGNTPDIPFLCESADDSAKHAAKMHLDILNSRPALLQMGNFREAIEPVHWIYPYSSMAQLRGLTSSSSIVTTQLRNWALLWLIEPLEVVSTRSLLWIKTRQLCP